MKRLLIATSLAAVLAGCQLIPGLSPIAVESTTPLNDAVDVDRNADITAKLTLAEDQNINLQSLTPDTVSLTSAEGAVEAERRMESDGTLVLDPTGSLRSATEYTFSIDGVKDEKGNSVEATEVTFTTVDSGNPEGDLKPGGITIETGRLMFTAGDAERASDTRSITLTNSLDDPITLSSATIVDGDAQAFKLGEGVGETIKPGKSLELPVTFTPTGTGAFASGLNITDSKGVAQTVYLGGLSVSGQGGDHEPSLQKIVDFYGYQTNVGDDDPETAALSSVPTQGLLGEELNAGGFKLALGKSVEVEVLANFSEASDPAVEQSYYLLGATSTQEWLFEVDMAANSPVANNQRLQPELDSRKNDAGLAQAVFAPGSMPFGFISHYDNEAIGVRDVYSEMDLNEPPMRQYRVYPLKGVDGNLVANAYIVAVDDGDGSNDFNDLVFVVKGVTLEQGQGNTPPPNATGIPGLAMTNALGIPSATRIVVSRVDDVTGDACVGMPATCNPERWSSMKFHDSSEVLFTNSGAAPITVSLSTNPAVFYSVSPTTLTIAPGATATATATFIASGLPKKGVYEGQILATSGANTAAIDIAGVYTPDPEGSSEVYLGQLVNNAFGYKTDMGATPGGGFTHNEVTSAPAGSEVRSAFWKAANSDQKITVTMLASYTQCCGYNPKTFDLELFRPSGGGYIERLGHDTDYDQSVLPASESGKIPNTASFDVSGTFRFDISGYSSEAGNGFMGVRFWPLVDENGNSVPNTYIVGQDYAKGPCNTAGVDGYSSNCDYNDSVYLVSNITPVSSSAPAPVDPTDPAEPTDPTAPVDTASSAE